MLLGILALNVLCLLAALGALWRLLRCPRPADAGEAFARVLAAAEPVARRMLGPGGLPAAPPPAAPARRQEPGFADDERALRSLGLGDRLIVLRHMLQGRPADEAAAAAGVGREGALAVYRVYRRGRAEPC